MKTMAVTELLNCNTILDKGERIVLEEIKKAEQVDDKSRHLHVIDRVRNYFQPGDFHWHVVGAVLVDGGEEEGGWVHFIGYKGHIKGLDISRPLAEQIKVEEDKAEIDCYLKSGRREIDYRSVDKLRELADIIQKRYLDGKF